MVVASTPSLPWKVENLGLMGVTHVMRIKTLPYYTVTLPMYYMTLNNLSTKYSTEGRRLVHSEGHNKGGNEAL